MEMHEIKVMEVVPRSCAHCIASGSQRGEGRELGTGEKGEVA